MPTYRVVKIFSNDFTGEKNIETTIWEGLDIDQLSKAYPPSKVFGADDLTHHEIEDGWIRWDYRFERQNADGKWVKCKDPRHPVSDPAFRQLEREIDKENRLRFPGDYADDDDEGEDDYFA
jgi:hypothetical protein